MLEDSVLDENKIKCLLCDGYGLEVTRVKKINRGSANVYNIDDKYILKEFSSDRNVKDIEKEYGVIKCLDKCGFRVPKYVETLDGLCYFVYSERIVIVQVFLAGYAMENNTGDYEKTIESATILGKLSKALEDYDLKTEYKEFPTREGLLEGVEKLKALKEKIKKDNPYREKFILDINRKIEIIESLLDFNFDDLKRVTLKLCHGDYSVQQLIYNDDLGTAIIDFETIKTMPIVWEIIRSYTYIDKDCKDGAMNLTTFVDYVREVMRHIKLTEFDLKYMPYIYLFQLSSSTFGYKQYNADYSKTELLEFALFRTNLCNYLFANLETISNALLGLKK